MIRVFVISFYILAYFLFGDHRKWEEYYPTILYAIIGNFISDVVFYQYSLWKYIGWPNHTLIDFFYMFVVYPLGINVYLTRFPKGKISAALYILAWTTVNTIFEIISHATGYFGYGHLWNAYASAGVFLLGFLLIKIHYERRWIVWPISFVAVAIAMWAYGMPFALLK